MGSPEGEGEQSEWPRHEVLVAPFSITQREVTVSDYKRCVEAGACTTEGIEEPTIGLAQGCNWRRAGHMDYPMNCLNWLQARRFARWLGGRLPSEAEWAFAASAGGKRWPYPWGSETPTCVLSVMRDYRGPGCGKGGSVRVCSRLTKEALEEKAPCDFAGNVSEWLQDEWHTSYLNAPEVSSAWEDSEEEAAFVARVLRGGHFEMSRLPRLALRQALDPLERRTWVGFRVARGRAPLPLPLQGEGRSGAVEGQRDPLQPSDPAPK